MGSPMSRQQGFKGLDLKIIEVFGLVLDELATGPKICKNFRSKGVKQAPDLFRIESNK